jgi:hypothetical protein
VRKRTILVLALGALLALLVGVQVAQAEHTTGHTLVSLAGSNFEIDQDANLKVDHDGTVPAADPLPAMDDWASIDPGTSADGAEVRKPDKDPGPDDDSFGQGSKEDTLDPTVVDGSIPPNKSDLTNFGVYLETVGNQKFLNLFWHRVQDPSGTTNMDFEFNRNKCEIDPDTGEPTEDSECNTNGGIPTTPVRTAGDLLIQYDLANGGTNPELFLSEWVATGPKSLCEAANSTPCWGDRINLSDAGEATGSINTSAIPAAESDGLGDVSPRTFGEAQVDFDALVSGTGGCVSFGSAYLKSRSSDSFTAAMKDFIAPASLGLNNCAQVVIRKQTLPDEDPNTTQFTYTHDLKTDPALVDNQQTSDINEATQFKLTDDGVFSNTDVLQNTAADTTYEVDESGIPTGYNLTDIKCDLDEGQANPSVGVTPTINVAAGTVTFSIDSPDDYLDCTYFNTRRQSSITTAQSFFPNDTATITGVNMAFDGSVSFELHKGVLGDTQGETCANTTDPVVYTQTVTNANLVNPNSTPASRTASTTNGVPNDAQADYSILAADAGSFYWEVFYNGVTDPDVTSCVENSTVSPINNGGTVNSS